MRELPLFKNSQLHASGAKKTIVFGPILPLFFENCHVWLQQNQICLRMATSLVSNGKKFQFPWEFAKIWKKLSWELQGGT